MTAEPESPTTARASRVRSYDLRERKRTRTRLMIQAEAMRLFGERGYAQTTVEDIADAAAISPRTFFRYFPTKEDVVLWDEYDPQVGQLLAARPDEEPIAESFRAIVRETLGGLLRRDPDELLARVRLLSSVPELRARFLEVQASGFSSAMYEDPEIAGALARRKHAPDDVQLRVIAGAFSAAVTVAIDEWQRAGGKSDLLEIFDQTVDILAAAIGELRPRARSKRAPNARVRRT